MSAARFEALRLTRRERLLSHLAQRKRIVFYSKIGLALTVVALFAMMSILPLIQGEKPGTRIDFAKSGESDVKPIMMNPKLQGLDQKKEPYVVTAKSALQKDANTIVMKQIEADLTTRSNAWLSMTANDGVLHVDWQKLMLNGHVHLFHDAGYEFLTEEAEVDTKTGDAVGRQPVDGQGKVGTFHAQGFAIYDKGDRMVFAGPVHMKLFPNES